MHKSKIKTLFIGTSEFAVPTLRALALSNLVELVGVVTQPDRPAGRKQELEEPAVKKAYLELKDEGTLERDVEIFQPDKIKNEAEKILKLTEPELIIVASYGQILPAAIINYPKYKCLNVHASLLPDLRGAVPIPMAILKGYEKTGVSIPVMTEGLDDGSIVVQKELRISKDDTTESLTKKLANLGAKLLIEVLSSWIKGEIEPTPQEESAATYCYTKDISKGKAEINFDKPIDEIERMIRAFFPWPVAWMWIELGGQKKRLKIYIAKKVDMNCFESRYKSDVSMFESKQEDFRTHIYRVLHKLSVEEKRNWVFILFEKKLFLVTKDGAIEFMRIQLEGKKVGTGKSYLYLAQKK
ncbi:methionyl-tRNA formyltransferase [Candidatus Dojkabacteria bacterium]|nr:methionyl-tRNA formyltransferase [Candidatus Dojkabacteria bacterium]